VFKDHEIELTWSIKSGKTRLSCNRQDISGLFKETPTKPTNLIEFDWTSSEGVDFRIVAHVSSGIVTNQYDLFINGKSFFVLPTRSDLATNTIVDKNGDQQISNAVVDNGGGGRISLDSKLQAADRARRKQDGDLDTKYSASSPNSPISAPRSQSAEEDSECTQTGAEQQERLAAAGFTRYQFDMEDELRSELYSSTLDVLRDEVSSSVPETEEMMSRAIINAFSEDHDSSDTSYDSLSAQSEAAGQGILDLVEFELDVMGEIFSWLKWSRELIPPSEYRDQKLEFMKSHVEKIFCHLRHERIPKDFASRLMVSMAIVLGLDVSKKLPFDTVIFLNLNSLTSSQDLVDAMYSFGEVSWAAVSTTHEGFGMCRLSCPAAVERVCSCSHEILINGREAELYEMYNTPFSQQPEDIASILDQYSEDDSADVFDALQTDVIDSSDEAIEATYLSHRERRSKSLSQSMPHFSQSGFESSNSSFVQRSSAHHTSTGTVSTLSTTEFDDFDTHATAIEQA